jgi:hypothetical protein
MSQNKVKFKLKGHEKFPLREGWLNKGIINVKSDPRVFKDGEGSDKLGVGSNMVKSIRYWMHAFGLIDERTRKDATILTEFGELIYKYDRYLEDDFTLWILHSKLAMNKEWSTLFYMFFNKCNIEEASKEELFRKVKQEILNYIGTEQKAPDGSIKDDLDVLLNMYSKVDEMNEDPEDKRISPFSSLGLVRNEKSLYIKKQPNLRKFSSWVVLYELSEILSDQNSVSIDVIAEGPRSLGAIYNLSRVTVNSYLDQLDNAGYIKVDRTAGLDVVYPAKLSKPLDIIKEYYKQHV